MSNPSPSSDRLPTLAFLVLSVFIAWPSTSTCTPFTWSSTPRPSGEPAVCHGRCTGGGGVSDRRTPCSSTGDSGRLGEGVDAVEMCEETRGGVCGGECSDTEPSDHLRSDMTYADVVDMAGLDRT